MFWTGTFTKVFVWYFSATMPLPALAFVDAFVIPTMTYSATESSNTWYLSNSWNNDSEIWFDHGAGGSPFWTALRMKLFSNEFLDAVDTSGSSLLDLSSVTANGTHYRATATGTNPSAYTVNLAQDFSARQFQICFNTTNSATYIKYHWYNYTANPCFMTVFFPNGTSVDINTNGTYTLDNCFVIELHNQKWRFIKTDNRTFTFTKLLGGTSYNQLKTQAKSFLIYRFDLYRATTSTTVETWFQNALEYFNQHGKTGLQEPINTSNINPYLVSSGIEDSIMLFSQGSIGSISGIAYNWNTLSFTVTASSGTTSTIQVYCGFQSEPTNVQGAMSWNYNSETKIVTINVLHASSKEIIIYFAEHDPPTTDISLNGVLGNNNWFISEVTVTLSATDDISGVSKTEYSFDNTTWITYTTPITITNEGNTTVYYRSTDNANNTETIKTETLKIDETTPSGSIIVNNGDAYTTSTSVMLTLTASDATSDVYQVIYSNDGVWDTESWENPSPTRTWTLTSGDGTKTVYCQIKDNAGLISSVYSDTIILDTTSPTGTIKINDDAIYTTTTSVTLILSATDTTSEVAEMCFSNDNITYTDWQAYATSKSWTLQDRDGTKTIYVQFRDQAGSISTYTDTIILDTVRPTGFLVIAGGATYTNSTSVNHALSADDETSGVAQMRFSHDNTTWASWETYSTSKAWELTTNDGTKIVYVQFMDNAGLISLTSQDSILLDTTKPTASAVVDQTMSVGTTMVFDAGDSTDNMNIVSFEWDFGDGTTATGITATHTYTNYGSFTVTLTVKDAAGNSDTDLITFSVPSSPATEFPMWKIGAIVATISIGIIATLLLRKRKCVRMRASSESFCLNNKPSVPTMRNGENLNLRGI